MKLAYLVNQYPMASLTFIRREIRALEALGHDIERLALMRWADQVVDPADQAEKDRTRYAKDAGAIGLFLALVKAMIARPKQFFEAAALTSRCWVTSDKSYLHHIGYLAEACIVRDWLVEAAVEHVHVHFASNSTEVAMLASVMGGPSYSFMVHGPDEFDRARCLNFDEKVRRAAFVATISSFACSQIFRWCDSADWPKVKVVRCGLDADFLEQPATDPPDVPRLVSIGRLSGQKGQQLLVEAAGRLAAKGADFELILIGDGEMRPQIEAKIAEHGLEKQVEITGWATNDEVRAQLESARACVLPSFAEGLPVVIMEAYALHRPVLSTYIAGIPELVEDGVNGWLVPAGSIDRLVEGLERVLDTPVEELARMGRVGHEAVAERHDVRKEAAVLGGLIEAHLASSGAASNA